MRRSKLYKAQLISLDSIREKINGGLSKIRQLQLAKDRQISTDFYLLLEKSWSIACWMRRSKLYKAQLLSSDLIKEKINGGLSKIRQLQLAKDRRISTDFYLLLEKSWSIACWMRRLKLYKAQLISSDSIREKINYELSKIRQLQLAKDRRISTDFYLLLEKSWSIACWMRRLKIYKHS